MLQRRRGFRCQRWAAYQRSGLPGCLQAAGPGDAGGMYFRRKQGSNRAGPAPCTVCPEAMCLCVAQAMERAGHGVARAPARSDKPLRRRGSVCAGSGEPRAGAPRGAALGKRGRIGYDSMFFKVCHFFLHYYQDSICRIP